MMDYRGSLRIRKACLPHHNVHLLSPNLDLQIIDLASLAFNCELRL